MHSQIWVVSTLLISIVLIVLTIVKFKFAVAGQLLRGNDDGHGATGYGKCY